MKKLALITAIIAMLIGPSSTFAASKLHKGTTTNVNTCSIVVNGVHYDCTQPVHVVSSDGHSVVNISVINTQSN